MIVRGMLPSAGSSGVTDCQSLRRNRKHGSHFGPQNDLAHARNTGSRLGNTTGIGQLPRSSTREAVETFIGAMVQSRDMADDQRGDTQTGFSAVG